MANEVTVDPRYMKYNKEEVEALLDKVKHMPDQAEEDDVRGIVRNYSSKDNGDSDDSSE